MTRRQAVMAVVATLLARPTAAQGKHPGHLTIPLDQWASLAVTYKGKRVTLPVAEVFETLEAYE